MVASKPPPTSSTEKRLAPLIPLVRLLARQAARETVEKQDAAKDHPADRGEK
jgi:hypothetical protein